MSVESKGDDKCPTGTCRQGKLSMKLRSKRKEGSLVDTALWESIQSKFPHYDYDGGIAFRCWPFTAYCPLPTACVTCPPSTARCSLCSTLHAAQCTLHARPSLLLQYHVCC